MPGPHSEIPTYPRVEAVIDLIASAVTALRRTAQARREFRECSAEDVRQVACDLGMTASDLEALVRAGPDAANEFDRLLRALGFAPDALAKAYPTVVRDMQRTCVSCTDKERCRHDLDAGHGAERFQP